ncbi:MAG: putative esterase [Saprospiraceae bacterium]|jgi:predicted esterase
MYQSHSLPVERAAHYYTLGTPGPQIKNLWIVCHGYGQLASRVIQKFSEMDDGSTLIIAPEGLSRFYWQGLTGRVAASWMTSMDRLEEIAEYTRFIKKLYDQYTSQLPADINITLFGFSQGCATQCRWLMREFPKFDNLVLWAGRLPEDLDYRPYEAYFASKDVYVVYGKEDEFLTPEFVDWQVNFAKEQKIKYQTIIFDGKHVIDQEELMKLYLRLKK